MGKRKEKDSKIIDLSKAKKQPDGLRASSKKPPSFSPFDMERMNREIDRLLDEAGIEDPKEAQKFIQENIVGKDLDQLFSRNPPSDSEKAQELAYQAMESGAPKEALRLARKALKLDPKCLDAQLLLVMLDDRQEKDLVEEIKKILDQARKDFGEAFFKEHRGYFWGVVETRPYMRTMQMLANLLNEFGEAGEEIEVMEEMIGLNSHDNQGIRYNMIGRYLEIGALSRARNLFNQYPDDMDWGVFAWALPLERYLSGDLKGAEKLSKGPEGEFLRGRLFSG
jgi:tetratricopeptide (TPR) repeat protein